MTHPTMLELSDYIDGMATTDVESHVIGCSTCQQAIQRAEGVPAASRDPKTTTAGTQLPEHIAEALATARQPDPARGQLWRCQWGQTGLLAVVWLVDAADVTLMPASFDVERADQLTLIVDDEHSPLHLPLGVWTALETGASTAVLDRCYGTLDDKYVGDIAQLRSARTTGRIPSDVKTGVEPGSVLDERAVYRSDLAATLDRACRAAAWEPEASDDLPTFIQVVSKLDRQKVRQRFGWSSRDALGVFQGRRAPRPDEMAALDVLAAEQGAEYLPSQASQPPPPRELTAELNRPVWRPLIRQRARDTHHNDETATRRQLVNDAQQLSLAARRDRDRAVDWEEIVGRLLL